LRVGRYSRRFKISRTPIDPFIALRRPHKPMVPPPLFASDCLDGFPDASQFSTVTRGPAETLEYRVQLMFDETPISFWHDVPLYPTGTPDGPVNFVCEIPKWTRAKFEIATGANHVHACVVQT
jgi:hypothetical protein